MKGYLSRLRQLLSPKPWKKEWQDGLNVAMLEAQKDLPLSLIVVVAKESDLYAEILFLCSFLGMSLGAIFGIFCASLVESTKDMMLFPVGGFALGATAYHFRHFFISKVAPRAVRERVAMNAKSIFLDHLHSIRSRLVLLYVSEMEHEALLVSSPDIGEQIPTGELRAVLRELDQQYEINDPLKHLAPALQKLAALLKRSYTQTLEGADLSKRSSTLFIGASDRPNFPQIPILKGSKDIN